MTTTDGAAMAQGEEIARLARDRNRAQDAARRAADALADLDGAVEAIGGYKDCPEVIRADAQAAAKALGRITEYARVAEKAAQDRFWEHWDKFRRGGEAAAAAAGGNGDDRP